ncbi:MAG: hypothetical protein FJ302_20660 [Planctomycetes bacterium]|nr:hypothetical protein [Planctomycetota bacterium]
MTLGSRLFAMLLALVSVPLAVGCGHSEGKASSLTVTLGEAGEISDSPALTTTSTEVVPVSANGIEKPSAPAEVTAAPTTVGANESRTFKVEGPEDAIRVSFDDVDLLKVMNLDPVPADAPERLPKWLKELDGKRIRVRGYMFPPFQDTGIRGFVLARDNQICCFGRTPKEYDLVEAFLRKGVTTHYIQNRPFDVVGVFRIKSEIEKYTAMYELKDAVVIEK